MPEQFKNLSTLAAECGIGGEPDESAGPEMTSPLETPNEYFAARYPNVADTYGDAVQVGISRAGVATIKGISESFFAAALGEQGSPEASTVFIRDENRFYQYVPAEGIYVEQSDAALAKRISGIFHECARDCETEVGLENLRFKYARTAHVKGVIERAKGILEQPASFFDPNTEFVIACANGMLRLTDGTLLSFGPNYRRRNKLAMPFIPGATCPRFLDVLMRPALSGEDLDLLQRWCGLALLGVNLAQAIVILSGTAGGGKGAFIRVVTGILGHSNVASLRTSLLTTRFEVGRLLGRTLLYGADVLANFLNCQGASVLKALTGGDPVVVELTRAWPLPACRCLPGRWRGSGRQRRID